MRPYSPGKPAEEVRRELGVAAIKLASNENPFGPSPKAVEAMRAEAERAHLYPDASAFELKEALSRKFSVPTEQIAVGNGSDELIHLLGLILLGEPGDEVIVGRPSFVRYDATAEVAACKLIAVPLDERFTHDLTAMARHVSARTKIVFIANPNNPTGTIVTRAELDAFLRDVPDEVAVVLDEAYYEYAAGDSDYPDSRSYVLEGRENLIGLRTFSKAYGLAGMRLGYGFMPAFFREAVEAVREPFSVNRAALAAGVAALADDEHVRRTVDHTVRAIQDISAAVAECGGRAVPARANFVLADFGRPARPIFEAMMRDGVIVRDGAAIGAPHCLRITVGTEEENGRCIEALRRAVAGTAVRGGAA